MRTLLATDNLVIGWIVTGLLAITGLLLVFGFPWQASGSPIHHPAHATGWVCIGTSCWSIDSQGHFLAPLAPR